MELYEKLAQEAEASEKRAFLGALRAGASMAAPAVGTAVGAAARFAGGAGKALMGTPLAANAGRAAQAGHWGVNAAQGASTVKGVYDTFKPPEPPPAPQGVRPGMKVGERLARLASIKLADAGWHTPVEIASYLTFAAPHAAEFLPDGPVKDALTSPGAKTIANASGLLGIGAVAGDNWRHGDELAAYDGVGAATMGAGVLHDYLRRRAQNAAA